MILFDCALRVIFWSGKKTSATDNESLSKILELMVVGRSKRVIIPSSREKIKTFPDEWEMATAPWLWFQLFWAQWIFLQFGFLSTAIWQVLALSKSSWALRSSRKFFRRIARYWPHGLKDICHGWQAEMYFAIAVDR